MIPDESLSDFISGNFKNLTGKMYRPSGWENKILVAFERENLADVPIFDGAKVCIYSIIA